MTTWKGNLENKLMSVQEAASFLRVSPKTLYAWVSQSRIPYRKAGRRVLFLQSELLAWTQLLGVGRQQHTTGGKLPESATLRK